MTYILRQLVSFLLLPALVAGLVPLWIGRASHSAPVAGTDPVGILMLAAGVAAAVIGLWLFGYSLAHFVTQGRGTLAPWDPPRRLVVSGPYRFVRNPMISGVCFVLIAEAFLLRSMPHACWAAAVVVINAIYIPLIEEPTLDQRFGEPYRTYSANVRRLLPRVRPWRAPPSDA